MTQSRQPRSGTRWAAITLGVLITVPYLAILVQSLRAALDPASVSQETLRDLAMLGAATVGDEAWIAFSYLSAVVGVVTLVVLLVIGGLIARRPAAREAAFAVFGAIGLVAALAGLGSLLGGKASSGSWLGVATAVGCGGVIVLLMLKSTATDFELAEMARRGRSAREGNTPSRGGGPLP